MKKKLFFIVFIAFVATSVFAQSESDFKVTLTADSKGAVVTGYTGTATEVTIPATLQGMPVREIGAQAFASSKVTSVSIPQGVKIIRRFAFLNAGSLKSITVPEGVTEIGERAFANCSSLTTVSLPASIESIGSEAFLNCRALTTVSFAGDAKKITFVRMGDRSNAFKGCAAIHLSSQAALRERGYSGQF